MLIIYGAAADSAKPKVRFAFWSGLLLVPILFIHDKMVIDEVKKESESKIADAISSPADNLIGRGEIAPNISSASGVRGGRQRVPPPLPPLSQVRGSGPHIQFGPSSFATGTMADPNPALNNSYVFGRGVSGNNINGGISGYGSNIRGSGVGGNTYGLSSLNEYS